MLTDRRIILFKRTVFLCCLLPLTWLVYRAFTDQLGANPIEALTHQTGSWALYLLLATLAITPLRRYTGWQWLARFRRMLGLYAFFYATVHFSIFLVFDHFFDWAAIAKDIIKRPYVTVGFSALLLLLPLAITSTDRMIRRLGGRRWKHLHKLIYLAAPLVIIHYLWLVKADTQKPILYGILLILLLLARLPAKPARATQHWVTSRV